MKTFIGLFVLAILLVVAGFAPKAMRSREQAYETRLLGALNAIERTVATSSTTQAQRVGLFAPKIRPGPSAGSWMIEGVVTSNDDLGNPSYARFAANLTQICGKPLDTACWQIDGLEVGDTGLVGGHKRVGALMAPWRHAPAAGVAG